MTALLEVAPANGSTFEVHLEPKPGGTARIGPARGHGSVTGRTTEAVAWLLVEGGDGTVSVGGRTQDVGGRADVFESPGWSAVLGPDTAFTVEGGVRYTLVWRQTDRPLRARI